MLYENHFEDEQDYFESNHTEEEEFYGQFEAGTTRYVKESDGIKETTRDDTGIWF